MTNHAHVLETIARGPTTRIRDIANTVGITARPVAQIVNDLVEAGYLTKFRDGRRTATKSTWSCRSATGSTSTTRSAS